jgi:hypothetical protein
MPDPRRGRKGTAEQEAISEKEVVAALEEKLERLRVTFEQYFLGIEKRPPLEKKAEIQRTIRQLHTRRIVAMATRFQFQAIVGRFNIFDGYWTRVMRQIEEGTYHRDLFKMKLHAEQKQAAADAAATAAQGDNLEAPPPSPPAEPFGLGDEKLRTIFESYVQAKRHCGEAVDRLTFESLRETLLREAPKIAEKNKVSKIDFVVVIRDGKPVLKAVPIRES